MTEAEIEELIAAFVAAARRDHESGFDGTDLFAGYNCLIDQFWSPLTNKRDDKWGGSFENRVRFSVEICRRIRATCGDRFIIGMTISGAEPYPGGLTIGDKQEIIAHLDSRGLVDYFSCGTGSYLNQFSKIVPSFHYGMFLGTDDAAKFKEVVKHARVTAEARVKTPENAEKVIAEGKADMVSIVRGQIADPHLANKAKEGRPEDIRPCISCNQLCLGRRLRDYWVSCISNPSVARETQWDGDSTPPAAKPRHVLVVGGGPAGLEVARVAAARGHRVTLAEKAGELGGQFRLAAGQPERGEIGSLLHWYRGQLEKLQVQVKLRTEMNAADIKASGADAVVLCTGSNPSRDGFQRSFPHMARLPGAALDLSMTGDTLRERFAKYGVEVLLATALSEWKGTTAKLINLYTGETEEREFDSLVLATTNTPEDRLTKELAGAGVEVHAIGDTVAARSASMAFYEGRKLALAL